MKLTRPVWRLAALGVVSVMLANSHRLQADDQRSSMLCDYKILGQAPFVTVELFFSHGDVPNETAKMTHYGSTKTTKVAVLPPESPDEKYHLVLEADMPGSEIFQVIYQRQDSHGAFDSKIVNPKSPMMKEIPGSCVMH